MAGHAAPVFSGPRSIPRHFSEVHVTPPYLDLRESKELRRRIGPKEVALIGLDQLIDDDEWRCGLFTGSNRYPAWDVRHTYDDPNKINRMDHLEYYRGDLTMRPMSLPALLRSRTRRTRQALGL